jgi:hypothetical protein
VFTPLNVSVPPLTFTNDPATVPSATTPAYVPLLNVNAVPFNVTNPPNAPSNVNNVTAPADNSNVPPTVTAAPTGTAANSPTLIVAPLATVIPVDVNRPLPLNANVPAFTLVVPVYVFTPLNVSAPLLTFTKEPAAVPSATTPAYVPLLNVNAVPFNVNNPPNAPSNLSNVTAPADNSNVPPTVTAAPTGTAANSPTLIVAPVATVIPVDANRPLPLNANVPAFTLVVPVYVFTPLNVTNSEVAFTNAPEPASTEATVPFFTKNAPALNTPPEINPPSNVTAVTA